MNPDVSQTLVRATIPVSGLPTFLVGASYVPTPYPQSRATFVQIRLPDLSRLRPGH